MQFSIREILLGTLAFAAIVALIVRNQPSQPTGLPNKLTPKQVAEEAAEKLGLKFKYVGGGYGNRGSDDQSTFRCQSTATIREPKFNESGKLMAQMRSIIRREIEAAGCTISGSGFSGDSEKDIKDFSFMYERDKARGEIFVQANEPETSARFSKDKHWQIWMLAYEYSK